MDRYQPMAPSSETPNPLRPYYRPPSIGISSDNATGHPSKPAHGPPSFGSSARDILSDLNYNEILGDSAPSTTAGLRSLLDQAMWKYVSVFMAQPFEVAKLVLQVRLAESLSARHSIGASPHQRQSSAQYSVYEDLDEDEDEDEPQYFTSTAPHQSISIHSTPSRRRREPSLSSQQTEPRPQTSTYSYLELKNPDSLMEVLSQLWHREGLFGVWKGTNATFLHSLLLKTLETWTRSMLSATLNLPDPGVVGSVAGVGGLDIIDSPSPLASLSIAVAASSIAGLLLAPLDIVRTKIILTPSNSPNRSIVSSLRAFGSYTVPSTLFAPTLIHAALPTLISTTTPLFLRSYLNIDPIITPTTYSVCTFISSAAELFLRLPFETVLRRGQMQHVLSVHQQAILDGSSPNEDRRKVSNSRSRGRGGKRAVDMEPEEMEPLQTIVEAGPYNGIMQTMWKIMSEEGESVSVVRAGHGDVGRGKITHAPRRGQGVQGLWRGWRVGWWGLVGVWGAAAMGSAGGKGGGEF